MNKFIVVQPAERYEIGVKAFFAKDIAEVQRRLKNGDLQEGNEVYAITKVWVVQKQPPLALVEVDEKYLDRGVEVK